MYEMQGPYMVSPAADLPIPQPPASSLTAPPRWHGPRDPPVSRPLAAPEFPPEWPAFEVVNAFLRLPGWLAQESSRTFFKILLASTEPCLLSPAASAYPPA